MTSQVADTSILIRLVNGITRSDRFRLVRYFFAGVAVSLGYTFTIVGLVDWLPFIGAEAANAISLIIWTIISYVVHREFTFRFDGSYGGSAARFIFVFVLKLIASVGVIALVTRFYQSSYLIGVLMNWVVLPLISYASMKLWVFEPALSRTPPAGARVDTLPSSSSSSRFDEIETLRLTVRSVGKSE